MLAGILVIVGVVVIAGKNATKNVVNGTHNYADGFSRGYYLDSVKYRDEQYNKK